MAGFGWTVARVPTPLLDALFATRGVNMAMSAPLAIFRFVAKAALNCVGFGVAGDFFAEMLPDVACEVFQRWAKNKCPEQLRAEIEAVAQASDEEARRSATQVVAEVAASQPPEIQLSMVSWLAQLPALVRQTQRRPADPSGRTILADLVLARPADVLALLPPRLPRFHKGERAPGFADWMLDDLLGIGGFGEVWKATNRHLPPVALKFCLDPTTARFLRNEADLLGRIVCQGRHPGIVALLDTALDSDPPCLKYELVPGGPLTGLIRQWHQEPAENLFRNSLAVMSQLADIISFAHRLCPPIVHRDLKPANVLVAPGEGIALKIADFGIGGIVSGQIMGTLLSATLPPTALRGSCTPLYASPQQLRGEDPDPRDDVFALGVLWYQMLTGELTERPGADWREEVESESDHHARGVPPAALELLGHCLAVKSERRPQHAGVLVEELARLASAHEVGGVKKSRVAVPEVVLMEEEDEIDTDDPLDLAEQVQKSLQRAQRTLANAMHLAEQRHDYAGAVQLLEKLPGPFGDTGLLDLYRGRRDRVDKLRERIETDARRQRFAGLHDRIHELLTLSPEDEEMSKLLQVVPWEPGAEIINSIGMKLLLIHPGKFLMGSPAGEKGRLSVEGPVHEVEITQRFYLGACPVTQEQYQRVMRVNPSHFRGEGSLDGRLLPVDKVSWEEAVDFCKKLSDLPEEKQRGRLYRLPTEAEWEYACRASSGSQPFSCGSGLSSNQANFDGRHPYRQSGKGEFLGRTSVVGSYPANALGLADMHGNVWEWCADWFSERYYRESPRQNPTGPDKGEAKVLRGGSWQNHGQMCRSACRDQVGPNYRSFAVGFRVMMMASPVASASVDACSCRTIRTAIERSPLDF